ncbi:hypothetical protein ACQP2T_47440 [Nonomuraea sp. CA-143628]|uniref:hypothetical protein n=1 Tax=Nonomuraea sp. CA-143628 TaxID=3239997 RepID=UPI003D94B046
MVTAQHEALHRIFQEDPSLFARTFERLLDIPLPADCSVSVIDTDLTELSPIERRVDTVLQLKTDLGDHLVIIEAQTGAKPKKSSSWAYYVSYLHAKHRCPVILVVVCLDGITARWARRPKTIGLPDRPTLTLQPIVLGPDNVPAITDVAEASADVWLTVFSALTHGRSPEVADILEVLATALDTIDPGTAGYCAELTEVGLGDTDARQLWRTLMSTKTYRYQSEFAQQLRAEGHAEGEAKMLLLILNDRGITISEEARERIRTCTDVAVLESWAHQALTITSADELFT